MHAPAGGSSPQPIVPSLVGREREREALHDALATALAGRGSLVLIGGEAGIGKTTLAESLLAEAGAQGALVLVGRCYDLAETPPYGPWRELFGRAPRDGGLPTLPTAVLPTEVAGDELNSQEAIIGRVRAYLGALSAMTPVVLLLDDLHWSEPASLDLLRSLARGLGDMAVLVLATYRADELTRRHPLYQLLPALVREAHAARVDVHPLNEADLRALARERYALSAADEARLVAYLDERAEGNPFYIGELLRTLEERTFLRRAADSAWMLGDLARAGVPPLLRQVIDARVDRLGEEARDLLAVAAVVGQEIQFTIWAAVAGVNEGAVLHVAERAAEVRLLEELADGARVRFVHALLREALYEGVMPSRRRVWHRKVAEVLASDAAHDPDAVAYHFQQAGDPRAGAWLVKAGDRAQRAYAWVSASAKYEAALVFLEQQDVEPLTRARLLHILALLARYTDRPRAATLLTEAAALAEASGDPVAAAAARFDRAHTSMMDFAYSVGRYDLRTALNEMRDTLPLLGDLPPERLAALPTAIVLGIPPGEDYHREFVITHFAGYGYFAEADALGFSALRMSPQSSYRALVTIGVVHALRGEPALALRATTLAEARARADGQHREVMTTLFNRAVILRVFWTKDLAARRVLEATAEAALPPAREADPALALTETLCLLWLVEGRWDEVALWAESHAERMPWVQALAARLRGDRENAWACVQAVLPHGAASAPGSGHLGFSLTAQQVAADLALDDGDIAGASAWLECHDRWLAWSGAAWGRAEAHLGWAAYHRAVGERALAENQARQAMAHASNPRQPLAIISAHRLLGELDTEAGRYPEAAEHIAAALTLADACAAPYERALTLLAMTEYQLAQGDRANAAALLDDARAILAPLGARPALARAEALAAKIATISAHVALPQAYPAGLSAREAEVLQLVAQGLSNAQAAERLFLSPRTVDQHLRSIYGKIGVDNRTAAARFAVEHGLA